MVMQNALGFTRRAAIVSRWRSLAGQPRALTARRAIHALDHRLRLIQGIVEYSARRDCVLRVSRTTAAFGVRLSDGAEVRPGDVVLDLHLWNEHIPRPAHGRPDCVWAAALVHHVRSSLRELAEQLKADPRLTGAVAIHARAALGSTHRRKDVIWCVRRLGFDAGPSPPANAGRIMHDLAENLWLWALAWAYNPRSSCRRSWLRDRIDLWISVDRLQDLYSQPSRKG